MINVINKCTDPYFNLAAEEYMLKTFKEDCFMLWSCTPSILVGKNQNTLSEINLDYVKKNDIPVVRRITGGGSVFTNLNFGFIKNDDGSSFADFKKFTKPILEVLKGLSVDAEFSGRNDLIVNGKKISGNAQYKYKDRILHHGTLLFNTNMADLSTVLKSKPQKFEDKSVKSISSRVSNISEYLKSPLTILEFKKLIVDHINSTNSDVTIYKFNENDIKNINKIVKGKYSTWEWNFGNSPNYSFSNEKKYPGGIIQSCFNVRNGIIKDIKFFGDFFSGSNINTIENALIGIKHSEEAIRKQLSRFEINDYFHNINIDNLIDILF